MTRPSFDDVQLFVYLATRDKDHPTTLADIKAFGCSYYMHELARALWQLVGKGTLAVQSGNIKNIEEF